MRCRTAQERMSAALAGALDVAERVEAEAHASRCARCADVVRDVAATAVAVERAYAPLRARTTALSPARVRLAARAPDRPSRLVRYARVTAKLNEIAAAAAVMVFAVLGSLPDTERSAVAEEAGAVGVVGTNILSPGVVERRVAGERSVTTRFGRLLLHEALLDPRVVPVGEAEQPILAPGQPY